MRKLCAILTILGLTPFLTMQAEAPQRAVPKVKMFADLNDAGGVSNVIKAIEAALAS